ncbi:MAG: LytTR family DNA-binding domain-containing protein [Terricaulis sp.]
MTLRILIVDDEPLALDRIRFALRAASNATVVGEALSGAEALKQVDALMPDIVLLDVQMPSGSGIDVARKLQAKRSGPEVIFATAFDSYATEAFDLDASDYLLKPIRDDRLLSAIDRAVRRIEARRAGERIAELELVVQALQQPSGTPGAKHEAEIWAPRRGGISRLPIENIIWIEAARDYLLVHTAHRSFILRETMSGIGKRLDPARMLRVHRSAFVNKSKIETASRFGRDGVSLTLTNGAVVRVGATYRDSVLDVLGTAIPNRREGDGEV